MPDKSTELQDVLVEELISVLKDGIQKVDNDGNAVRENAPASYATAAVAYLKAFPPGSDDLITAKPAGVLKKFADQTKPLPFPAAEKTH